MTPSADEGERALTRRARGSVKVMPALVLAAAGAMTWITIVRLDAVAEQLPGIWAPEQLLPIGHDAFYSLDVGQAPEPPGAADHEQQLRTELRALIDPAATDVAVASWREHADDFVAVAVVETTDPVAAAIALDRPVSPGGALQAVSAWAEGDRYVVVVGVAASSNEEATAVADRVSRDIATSVLLARVLWFVAIALIPAIVLWLTAATAYVLGVVLFVIASLAGALVRVVVLLVIQLPLAILTRGRLGKTKLPRISTSQFELPPSLGPDVQCVDVDETDVTAGAKSLAAAGRALFLMAIALPALIPSWWPGSLVWAVAAGAWFALGRLRRRWPILRGLRWALIGLTGLAIAEPLAGFGPGTPTTHPVVAAVVVVVSVAVLFFFLRDALSSTGDPTYVSSFSDLGPRSIAYLIGALGISFAATCLFLGSNGDRDVGSHVVNKSVATLGLLAVPVTVRRFRAAQAAARRDWAREHGVGEVLLLRSFLDDGLKIRSRMRDRRGLERLIPMSREPFEDVVVRAFEARGPVVAIAKPGTTEGEFGAARDRIVVADWLTAVKTEMAESSYVVAVLGPTHGLRLELETLSSLDLLPRVCLLVPPVDPADAAARIASGTSATSGPGGWGTLDADHIGRRQVLALAGVDAKRILFVCRDRDSVLAYLRLGEWLAVPP